MFGMVFLRGPTQLKQRRVRNQGSQSDSMRVFEAERGNAALFSFEVL